MKVKAASGVRVPMEDAPHKYITDSESVDVENSTYYLRRLADGDLIDVEEVQAVMVEEQAVKNTQKNAKTEK